MRKIYCLSSTTPNAPHLGLVGFYGNLLKAEILMRTACSTQPQAPTHSQEQASMKAPNNLDTVMENEFLVPCFGIYTS